ncbi:PAS domain-containing protein [Yinghuangia seranimata]|uniref:PAS domain-containing protein n=1 Tax=Yinghuangia seranimata TaxID=408067 RepID=UPI00248C52E0|nr:PAS domain-containing protein [Yinghuangia seranimata]MDI2130390.1 PAS domain-containing protein [Yinghuangia seranimata]
MSSRPSRGAARLAAILDALPDALLLVNRNGTVVNANAMALEALEAPGTPIVGRGLLDLLPTFDRSRIPGSVRAMDVEPRTKPTRMTARRTDGSLMPVEVTSANLPGAYDDELLMIVVRDLTGSVDVEAELQRQQRQTEMILRAATEGIIGIDSEGSIVLANPAAARILRHRASDLGGRSLHELLQSKRADGSPMPADECPPLVTLNSGRKQRLRDQVLWRGDGEPVHVEMTTAPILLGEAVVGAVMTFTDLTRERGLAEHREQLAELLDGELLARIEASRARLKTLADGSIGELGPSARRVVRQVAGELEEMAGLTTEVLDHQRGGAEPGTEDKDRAAATVDDLLDRALETVTYPARAAGVEFTVTAAPVGVRVDVDAMTRALGHLIADTVAAGPKGSTVVVAAAQRGEVARIEVRGPASRGSSVHVPLARSVIEAHGGTVESHTVEGRGSTYVVELPADEEAAKERPGEAVEGPRARKRARTGPAVRPGTAAKDAAEKKDPKESKGGKDADDAKDTADGKDEKDAEESKDSKGAAADKDADASKDAKDSADKKDDGDKPSSGASHLPAIRGAAEVVPANGRRGSAGSPGAQAPGNGSDDNADGARGRLAPATPVVPPLPTVPPLPAPTKPIALPAGESAAETPESAGPVPLVPAAGGRRGARRGLPAAEEPEAAAPEAAAEAAPVPRVPSVPAKANGHHTRHMARARHHLSTPPASIPSQSHASAHRRSTSVQDRPDAPFPQQETPQQSQDGAEAGPVPGIPGTPGSPDATPDATPPALPGPPVPPAFDADAPTALMPQIPSAPTPPFGPADPGMPGDTADPAAPGGFPALPPMPSTPPPPLLPGGVSSAQQFGLPPADPQALQGRRRRSVVPQPQQPGRQQHAPQPPFPGHPEQPGHPGQPGHPMQPGQLNHLGQPDQQPYPGHLGHPGYPGYPGAVDVDTPPPGELAALDPDYPAMVAPTPDGRPRRLLVWPAPDGPTAGALSARGWDPVLVRSREEVDASASAHPAALFVDPLTGPITRTALQSLRTAATAAEIPVLVTAGLMQATRDAAFGADPAVLLRSLAPADSPAHASRVLLVEGDADIAAAFTGSLARRGMDVVHVTSESEAVSKASSVEPNLVVLDLMLVRRRRLGIVDWLRNNQRLHSTPIVVYTTVDIAPEEVHRLRTGETVLFLAERSTRDDVQQRVVDLLGKIASVV